MKDRIHTRSRCHFLLCRTKEWLPDGWSSKEWGEWHLSHPPALQTLELRDAGDRRLGWILGQAMDPGRRSWLESPIRLEAGKDPSSAVAALESLLHGLTGCFVAILLGPGGRRVYGDAGGSFPILFNPSLRAVASCSFLIPAEGEGERRDGLASLLAIDRRNTWFPFGTTPRDDTSRLLPNHYLDLDTLSPVRHWPKEEPVPGPDTEPGIHAIGRLLRDSFATLTARGEVYLSLTGGNDTRMLLAAARPYLGKVKCFTLQGPRPVDQEDLRIALSMVHRLDLDHEVLEPVPLELRDFERYLHETSFCVTPRPFIKARPIEDHAGPRPVILGLGGVVTRAAYWEPRYATGVRPSAVDVLKHLQFPPIPPLPELAGRCLEELAPFSPAVALDLLYVEQRQGGWAGPSSAGIATPGGIMPLLCNREIYSLCMQLPPAYRREHRGVQDLIRSLWPELLEIPFAGGPGHTGG